MLGITIYEVKEKKISNRKVRERMESAYTLEQMMELRRARWLEKLSHMNETRAPRKLLVAWIRCPRANGKPQQTIRHGFATTIINKLQIPSSHLKDWITTARDHKKWAQQVEQSLGIVTGTYKPYKLR